MSHSKNSNEDAIVCTFLEGVRKRCPENPAVLETLGDLYTKNGRYEEGLEIDRLLTSRFPDNEMYWYNLACSYCLLSQSDSAIKALNTSVELGYRDLDWMMKDKDLAAIRKHPDFIQLTSRLKSKPA